ncbi:hypothetical protein QOZ83_16935 [Romboutsia sedimentorum]|uniref:hypothetical protein n=1 Tax=Romboutsia sedimentorum TaxID=1368474 RepID=UPI0024DEB1B5|nr:hypothetical protein [Romboutsia sedimentorum]MDK2587526.1 hypothetical protein [Romboutsia sedimentorum]
MSDAIKDFLIFNKIEECLLNSILGLFKGIVLSSYWICLIGGMIGVILYMFGWKNGKKAPMLSMAIYVIIRILGSVILGV